MKKLLALLFLAVPCLASGPKYLGSDADPMLYQETVNLYHDIANPVINIGQASTMTITYLNVSSITLTGTIGITSLNLTTGTINSFMVVGTSSNNDAPKGRIGEVISASVVRSAAVGLTNGTFKTIASVPLTPGNWDLRIMAGYLAGAGTSITNVTTGISLTDNTRSALDTLDVPNSSGEVFVDNNMAAEVPGSGNSLSLVVPPVIVKVSSLTTYYFVSQGAFSVSTLSGFGSIVARRVF